MRRLCFFVILLSLLSFLSCGEDKINAKHEGETSDLDSRLSDNDIHEDKNFVDNEVDDETETDDADVTDVTSSDVDQCVEKDADTEQTDDEGEDNCPYENFPNYNNGDCWSDNTGNPMEQYNAKKYCEELGGRLPTISELRTLIKNCPATESGGSCGVTDSCSTTSCWDETCDGCIGVRSVEDRKYTRRLWSMTVPSDRTDLAWYVNFNDNSVDAIYSFSFYNVRCIR